MKIFSALAFACGATLAGPSQAQWTAAAPAVEIRGGTAVGSWNGAGGGMDLSPSLALSASGAVMLSPMFGVEAGYSRASFGCTRGFCAGNSTRFTSAGFTGGVRVVPLHGSWLRAGITFHTLEMPGADGAPLQSRRAPGVELAGGFVAMVRGAMELAPGIRYMTYSAHMPGEDAGDRVHHFTADVGLRVHIGRLRR
jgi:hypothetical protein